jgi:geranylgeranylglycerol-phosphate geranylgeranyltransferase
MVLNDLFDIELDKINNPTRPLITGEITEKEAMGVSILFIFLINYLTRTYLSINLQVITNLMLIGISIYTPFFKRITFIKNLYCAFTVSFSIFYTGLASIQNINYENINYKILLITISYIFFGSLNNELLLDIKDIKGDKQNNIITVPVLLGEKKSLIIINLLLYYNIISNTLSLIKLHNNLLIGIIPILIFIPMIKNINKICKSNYSSESIDYYLKNTTIPMFLLLLYMCILSYIQK